MFKMHSPICTINADGESMVTLGMILVFATCANRVPPLGFPERPRIQFAHSQESPFPMANTCALVLTLPVHATYAQWKEKMESGIVLSPILGRS